MEPAPIPAAERDQLPGGFTPCLHNPNDNTKENINTMKRLIALCAAAVLCLSLLSACGGKPAEEKKVDLAAFAQTLKEQHEFADFVERLDVSDEFGATMLEGSYPALKGMDLEQLEIYLSMISFSTGEFALAQAKSTEDAAKVKEAFEARIATMTEEGMQYPETVELWSKSARVAANGTYVMLVCHADADAIVSEFEALFK